MNLLFICTENKLRSPTAECVFGALPGIAALSTGTNKDAETSMSGDVIEWADHVFVMEQSHKRKVTQKFGALLRNKAVTCLAVPDNYAFMQDELVALLKQRVGKHVDLDALQEKKYE